LRREYPIDVIEIDYNFRRVIATGPSGKMVIARGIAAVDSPENNVIAERQKDALG
jgi:hypothetical protein